MISRRLRAKTLPSAVPISAQIVEPDGRPCSACRLPVRKGPQWQLEFPGELVVTFHEECERLWRRETGN